MRLACSRGPAMVTAQTKQRVGKSQMAAVRLLELCGLYFDPDMPDGLCSIWMDALNLVKSPVNGLAKSFFNLMLFYMIPN
jgi:hypothetical protein